ncbi:MAG: hypothetical protein K5866_02180 [Treponema sp.]|nr:hypothetical protein [Treponema sp.]
MKKVFKLFIVSLLLIFSSALIFAQENQNNENEGKIIIQDKENTNSGLAFRNAIGGYFVWNYKSPIGGIQYERWVTDLLSTKFNFYVFYDPSENFIWEHLMDYTITTEFNLKLYETAFNEEFASRLFAFLMLGHRGYSIRTYERDESYNISGYSDSYYPVMLASLGFGFDFIFAEHLSIPFQIGFMGAFPNDEYAALCIGTGIRYIF